MSRIELKASGLPIFMDDCSGKLFFEDGLTVAGSGGKDAGQMSGLLRRPEAVPDIEHCYDFYRDIVFERDRETFSSRDYRYDITVIMPGTLAGERKKTSGHYHGRLPGQAQTYPEVYEVLCGRALFMMQKVPNFDSCAEPEIEDLKAVYVEAGQAVVIPPFYGHCSINAGDGILAFSNIAVVSCPVLYDAIKAKHGLAVYALEERGGMLLQKNPNYASAPEPVTVFPRQAPELGITFGRPAYREYIDHPEKFAYLADPADYISQMLAPIE